jgi:hypothetical protein
MTKKIENCSVTLHCSTNSSDKIYKLILIEHIGYGLFDLMVEYGRRNTILKQIYKCEKTGQFTALNTMHKIEKEKINKGYSIIGKTSNINIELERRIETAKVQIEKIKQLNIFSTENIKRLMGMINSCEEETLALAENIIKQKIVTA